MTWLHYLRELYSLNTLDARFAPQQPVNELKIDPAKPSPEELKTEQNGGKVATLPPDAREPKWGTPEFLYHYIVLLFCVPLMFYIPYNVSKASDPHYSKFEYLLSPGWIPGRKVDNSDAQYASFRDNIPYMAIVLVSHPILRKLYDLFWRSNTYTQVRTTPGDNRGLTQGLSASAVADARKEQRISFDLYFAITFITALHGVSALKVLLILYVNFKIATDLPRKYVPAFTWIFNIAILFANELSHGYAFEKIAVMLSPSQNLSMGNELALVNWGKKIDGYGGIIPRWEVLFKITVLRLISFNFDYYWSLNQRGSSSLEKKQLDPSALPERDRVSLSAKPIDYTFRNYLAYALYSPLYLAGPIVTFNDYISQLRYPLASVTTQRTLLYGIRFLLTLFAMELILHYIYAVAISKADPDWSVYSPSQLSMLAYFNLHHIWLKLLIPWRFFRLWALCDGIDPPENMVRCMSDNYSALGFWRSWHRSFNRWTVRYIFIPLGGSRRSAGEHPAWVQARAGVNFAAVFMFVAIWHDIQLRLLMWGWLVLLFILPEVLATRLFPKRKFKDRPDVYRWICGVGAAGNILMMMAANLVGFAVGLDGLKGLVQGIAGTWSGLLYLIGACGALFTGAQIMYEIREEEMRHGIHMKC